MSFGSNVALRDQNLEELLVLIAPPGMGKGTLRKYLESIGFFGIEASTAIRTVCMKNPHIRAQVERFKKEHPPSALLGDTLMNVIFDEYMHQVPNRGKQVYDGYPRTIQQVEHFLLIMTMRSYRFKFLFLDGPDEVCTHRALVSRKHEGRKDDTPDIFKERLALYRREYPELRMMLETEVPGRCFDIDAVPPFEEVAHQVMQVI